MRAAQAKERCKVGKDLTRRDFIKSAAAGAAAAGIGVPFIVPKRAYSASAPGVSLRIALRWWVLGVPLVVLYFGVIFRLHRGKVSSR